MTPRVRSLAAACASAALLALTIAAGTASQAGEYAPLMTGMHVPWAAGGDVADAGGTVRTVPSEWPSVNIHAVRLWDTRTAWLNLEPADGQWEFTQLDKQISQARSHSVADITLVLWGTPAWAASSFDSKDAPWMGPGSASAPKNLGQWDEYVRTVATKYKGVITSYEIGNEPNLATFWRGTPEAYAQLVARAAQIIHDVDPAATVIAPGPCIRDSADIARMRPYWQALGAAKARVDVVAFHWYPTADSTSGLAEIVNGIRNETKDAGLPANHVWMTELGFRASAGMDEAKIQALPAQVRAQAQRLGLERLYWYAWTSESIGNLLPLHEGTALANGLRTIG